MSEYEFKSDYPMRLERMEHIILDGATDELIAELAALREQVAKLTSEREELRDLLKSAVHGVQVVSMKSNLLAHLVDGELVIEAWRADDD